MTIQTATLDNASCLGFDCSQLFVLTSVAKLRIDSLTQGALCMGLSVAGQDIAASCLDILGTAL